MIHMYFITYSALLLVGSVTQFALGSASRRAGVPAGRYLSWFHATVLVGVLSSCVLFYVSPNVLALDPLGSDMGMAYFNRSPALLVFLALCAGARPFSFFFLYAFLSASGGTTERSALRGWLFAASALLGAWFVGSNLSVPLIFRGDERAKRIVCAVNDQGMLALQLILAGALAVYRGRTRAKGGSPTLHDYLVAATCLVALVNVGRFLWMPDGMALLFTERELLLCLLVDVGALSYSRPWRREASAEPARSGTRSLELPDGFAGRYGLTPRETEIVSLLAAGMANKDIGSRLGISYNTVKNHVSSIFVKLSVESRFEIVSRVLVNED